MRAIFFFILFVFSLNAEVKLDPLLVRPKPPGDYKLKIGDKLNIQIYGDPNSTRLVEVGPSGNISYLFVNSYPAVDKTIPELRLSLEKELNNYFKEASLAISLSETLGDFYVINGEVYSPGIKPLIGKATILTALAEGEGLTMRTFRRRLEELANLDKAFLSRNGEYIPVNFNRLVKYGDMSQNIPLQQGDYIYIPSIEYPEVYIVGEVKIPITLQYIGRLSLPQAISQAGGITERASSRVAVIRGSLCCPKKYLIDYNRIVKGKAENFWLQPGDIVYVPIRTFNVAVDIFKIGVRAFIAQTFTWLGNNLLIQMEPGAAAFSNNVIVPPASGGAGVAAPAVGP